MLERTAATHQRHRFAASLAVVLAVLAISCRDKSSAPAAPPPDAKSALASAAPTPPSVAGSAPSLESAGCAGPRGYDEGTNTDTVSSSGDERSFRVHVPPGREHTEPLPLVLLFHGGGGSGRQLQMRSSRMDGIADREGFITVYPDGTGILNTWNAGGCCGGAKRKNVDDVAFVSALLDHLEQSLCIDRRRVFATGMSNGGMLAHRLACDLSERIAAVAPVAATNMTKSCTPARRIAVLQIHGTDDRHVPWNGGEGCGIAGVPFTSIPDTMEAWRTRNGCAATTSHWRGEGDGACKRFDGCTKAANVALCTIDGGGHSWPGGVPRKPVLDCPGDGHQSQSFSVDEMIWRFFSSIPVH